MTEAMNEQNEFLEALDEFSKMDANLCTGKAIISLYNWLEPNNVRTIRKSLEFMAANHEALREGVIVPSKMTDEMAKNYLNSWDTYRDMDLNSYACHMGAYADMIAAAKLSQGD